MAHAHNYKIKSKTNKPGSQVEIDAVLSFDEVSALRSQAIKHLGAHVAIDGFRKGHIPESVLVSRLGEFTIIEEAAGLALAHIVPEILIAEKVAVLAKPSISITKLAPGNDVEFKIAVAVIPSFDLPDYKKIAKQKNAAGSEATSVEESEVTKVVDEIRKMHGIKKEGSDEKISAELTDEFVKKLGDFKDVADFKAKVTENMRLEKEARAKEKKRLEIAEEIVAKTIIDLPEVLVESEMTRMENQFKEDILRMGIKFDDYLKHLKKTLDEVRKDWRPDAEKRAKLQLILHKIADAEKLYPAKEAVGKETAHILEHYKGADPERAAAYVEMTMTNQNVFEFLEAQE